MLTRMVRLKLVAFLVIGATVLAYTFFHYADLGRYVGLRGYYVVRLELTNAGGIFPDADVTYRGVSVGRVGAVNLTATGVEADLDISDSAPPIPDRLHAAVADLSAVGEQYVDLRPAASSGPYLADGSVIPVRDTSLPLPVTSLLTSINALSTSLPLGSLRTVMNELSTGLAYQGTNLQGIIDGNSALIRTANANLPQTTALINNSRQVLSTQLSESSALTAFGQNSELLASQLDQSNGDLQQLIVNTPLAASQVTGLLQDNNVTLGALIANLLTTSEVTLTRGKALDELLSVLPAAVAAGSTVITPQGARFGVVLTFFNPLPCTAGYGGTVYRNGLDTSPGPPLNTSAQCTAPASSGQDVRGSAHAPADGGVPSPAKAGLARLLGLSP
jgi:phospholipid/cholesterol/gamma-HCH transport system substrate-binding protein